MMMILVITMVIRQRRWKVHFSVYFSKNPLLTFSSIFVVCWSWLKGFALNLWGQTWPQKENASNKPLITGLSIAVSAGIIFKSRASTTQSGATVWTKLISNLHSARTIWYSSNWMWVINSCYNLYTEEKVKGLEASEQIKRGVKPMKQSHQHHQQQQRWVIDCYYNLYTEENSTFESLT